MTSHITIPNDSEYGYYEYDTEKLYEQMEPKRLVVYNNELYISLYYQSTKQKTLFHKVNEFYQDPNDPEIILYEYCSETDQMYLLKIMKMDKFKKYTKLKWFTELVKKKMVYHFPEYFL